ncbi:MAG: hypothetical protein HYZ75_11380 [Elusimicrobia bacterium]|nr:hypothetical protein [Elusimicrobiota bacterium]
MRHQRRAPAGVARLWTFALVLAATAPAAAQQVLIDSMWVHSPLGGGRCSIINGSQISCDDGAFNRPLSPQDGSISNDPHIEFARIDTTGITECNNNALIPPGDLERNVCNARVFLCVKIGWSNTQPGNTPFALDFVNFEVFKFQQGSNPLDAGSTPPLRTFFVDNPGQIPGGSNTNGVLLPPFCVMWDGSINIQGEFGKSNGQYGFRATVATNQTGASGNINITQTRAYPGGFTRDANLVVVDEKPIIVDVTDVHVVRASPTVVGDITGVAAEPYNLTYRLAKDATMFLTISQVQQNLSVQTIRTVVDGLPRVGEGIPSGTLQNGDAWNGRFENGDLGPPGVYLATLQSFARDQFGPDLSAAVTRQIALDTLQITDIRVQPLTDQSTSLAVLSYAITEPGNVYIDIFPPGTAFTRGLNSVNDATVIPDVNPLSALGQLGAKKDFGATANPIRHIEEQKDFRKSVISFWDGRDASGNIMPDGDYVFVIYASLPSQNGFPFNSVASDKRIWSSIARSGFLTIARGMVTISQIGPASTVIGSSPPVAGLDPFTFSYSLSREALVTIKIFNGGGSNLVKTLITNEIRPGNFLNRERWVIPTDDAGLWVSSGPYLVQLTAADPFFPVKVATTTSLFFVNAFRIADVTTTPLLTGATDVLTLSYQLSQPMLVAWNIYPPGTVISGSSATWPPCGTTEPNNCAQITLNGANARPLVTIKGMRPGRLRVTEFWDGRDIDGLFVPDGLYVFVLSAQSTTTPKYFATDQIFGNLTVARGSIVFPQFNVVPTFPTLFNSSQTISLPPYEVGYSLTRQSSVTIQVLKQSVGASVVKTLISGQVRDSNILNKEFWDGRNDQGSFVEPGFYTVRAVAEDLASTLSSGSTAQMTVSVNPLRIYDVAVSPLRPEFGNALLAYQVSETMKVAIKIYRPGTTFDPNGNPTPPESRSLVKRITGVRPARAEVSEIWDGTDESLAIVPDGNYIFKIVGSTSIDSIDTITGNVAPGSALAEDLIIAEVPVVRGGSLAPESDFFANTFVYPNPLRDATATFKIYSPLQGRVTLKIYNIAGEQVLDKDFGVQAADTYINYVWDKSNQHGRKVAHGVYFALIREEGTRGEKSLFQIVKKMLIP